METKFNEEPFDPWEHFYDDDYEEQGFQKMKPKLKKVKKEKEVSKKKNKRI